MPAVDNLPARVSELQRAIAQVATVEDAATLANQAAAIADVLKRANLGLHVQNEATALRLHAERKLGELLTADNLTRGPGGPALADYGITKNRSSQAQKLARIPTPDFDTYISNTQSAGKELTHASALRLLPTTIKPERKSIADAYTAPPIDVGIARAFGLEASDIRADLIADSVQNALVRLENPRHAYVWAKYHGIQDNGTIGDAWTFAGIAATNGWTREYAEGLYYRASHHIRGQIAVDTLNQLSILMAAM